MDANLIYIKTPAGEEAVRQRTRVVQRNTRMVLILVDGNSTVGELCQKTGNEQLVESALLDLERDGLIVPKLDQDSVWEQSKKIAEEIREAAVKRLAKEMPKEVPKDAPILPAQAPVMAPEPFSVAPVSIAPFSTFGGQAPSSMAPFSTFGGPPSVAPVEAASPPPAPVEEKKAGLLSRLFKREPQDDEGIGPIRKGRRGPFISLPLAIAIAVVGVLALAVLLFLLYPYDSHRARIEEMLTRATGHPVRVGAVHAELLPKPGIVISRVGDDAAPLQVARVRLIPELFSLLGSRPVFSSVEVEGARVSERALGVLPKAATEAFSGNAGFMIRSLQFSALQADLLGLSVAGLNAELRPDDKGALGPLVFHTTDRSFKATLSAASGRPVADIEAIAWQAADSRFRFDSLQAQLSWDERQLTVGALDARIFDGSIIGALTLDRAGGQPGIAGDLTIRHMNLQRLSDALGYGKQYEGELAGALRISGRAADWSALPANVTGEGTFGLIRGSLGGMDLVEAVRRGKTPVRGGNTRYEQLNGSLRLTPDAIVFSDLVLTSGLLRATGSLEVSHESRVAGRLDVEMRGTANVVRMPVTVSGSLKDPVLQGGR